jgi:hypothetical protein
VETSILWSSKELLGGRYISDAMYYFAYHDSPTASFFPARASPLLRETHQAESTRVVHSDYQSGAYTLKRLGAYFGVDRFVGKARFGAVSRRTDDMQKDGARESD